MRVVDRVRGDSTLLAAVLMGFALRVGWLLYAHPTPVSDFASYRKLGNDILHWRFHSAGIPTARRTPGYPAVLALGSTISDSPRFLGLVNCVLSTSLIAAVAFAARRFALGERVRSVAVWATALNPTFVVFSAVLASENLQLPLVVTGSALALGDRDGEGRSVILGFLVLGAATLVRAESAVFVAVVVVAMVVRRVPLRRVAALGAVSVAVVVPWVVRNEIQVGRGAGIASTSGENFYFAHGQDELYGSQPYEATEINIADEVARSKAGWRLAWRSIRADPARLWHDTIRGTQGYFGWPDDALEYATVAEPQRVRGAYPATISDRATDVVRATMRLGWLVLAGSAAVGAGLAVWRRDRTLLLLAAFAVAGWFVTAVVFFAKARFRLAAEPFLILLAAGAFAGTRIGHTSASGPPEPLREAGPG